jgi:hypothetical protein
MISPRLLMPSGEVPTRASGTSKVVQRPLSSRKPVEGVRGLLAVKGSGRVGSAVEPASLPGWHCRSGAHRERRHGDGAGDGQANATASSAACYPGHAVSFQFASLPAVRVSGGGSISRRASAWKPGLCLPSPWVQLLAGVSHRLGSRPPSDATYPGNQHRWIGQPRGKARTNAPLAQSV